MFLGSFCDHMYSTVGFGVYVNNGFYVVKVHNWCLYFVAECTKSSENYHILCVLVFLGAGHCRFGVCCSYQDKLS